MTDFSLRQSNGDALSDHEEIVVVTRKQYIAVADDFLRKLFPELASNVLPRPCAFTVFIKDDDHVRH